MRNFRARALCLLLCILTIGAVACQTHPEQGSEQTTQPEQNVQTQTGQPTGEETTQEVIPMDQPRNVGERYFVYRIWNFTPMTQDAFEQIVDEAAKTGFNAIKVHIPWSRVESTKAGEYDFAAFDDMINYVVKTKGLKVAISIDLTRRADDKIIPLDQMQYDPNGNLCQGGSIDGMRTMISFCSESAVSSAVNFYAAAVERYEALYAEDVLFYLPAFSQFAESEYWCAGEYDYSDPAKAQFRAFLQEKYTDIDALNCVLGTEYASFDQIQPPSCTASDNLGQLWYQFRHQKLKEMIDSLAIVQKQISPDSKYALQFGSIYDTASLLRCTLAAGDLAEHADVVWIDDGPLTDHEFSMDHAHATFPPHVMLAQEIDGPVQVAATPENYLEQGMDAYGRGCTYVSIANWEIDQKYREYEWVWKQLIDTWLGDNAPEVIDTTKTDLTMDISLTDHLRKGTPGVFITRYYALATKGEFVKLRIIDDLTDKTIDQPLAVYSFPSSFSTEQGKDGWFYMSYDKKRGEFGELSFDTANNRWAIEGTFTLIMSGAMHPDEYDSALVFEAPKSGKVCVSFVIGVNSEEGDGVKYALLLNGEHVLDAEGGYVFLPTGRVDEQTIDIDVQSGDRIAIVLNKNGHNSFDSTSVSCTVEYLQ